MRTLRRNYRKFYYANYLSTAPILDEDGYETGEYKKAYEEPKVFYANYGTNSGKNISNVFGFMSDSQRAIAIEKGKNPLKKNAHLWLGVDPTKSEANYVVTHISDSINSDLVLIEEIAANENIN